VKGTSGRYKKALYEVDDDELKQGDRVWKATVVWNLNLKVQR